MVLGVKLHPAIVEMLSLPQRLYSLLCVGAAGTNYSQFNKQTLSWLFIWVTGPSGEKPETSPFAA